jgi:2-phospho-L-lactate guanylyltransferase (CobY/MobA/RfbA family)
MALEVVEFLAQEQRLNTRLRVRLPAVSEWSDFVIVTADIALSAN